MRQLKTRNEFPALLREMGLVRNAAEVGVAEGYFSWHILDHWPGRLWMIDPWAVQDEPGYSVHGDHDQDARYHRIVDKALTYKGRAEVVRDVSLGAVKRMPDGFFDFVYIDANHLYKSARADINSWWDKVHPGGILAGHDYLEGSHGGSEYGVKRAVDEFVVSWAGGLQVNVTQEKDWPSWWIMKI